MPIYVVASAIIVPASLDPTTPIGAAVDALGRLNDANARGVVYVDARPAR